MDNKLVNELTEIQDLVDNSINCLDRPHSNYVHIAVSSLKGVSSKLTNILNELKKSE